MATFGLGHSPIIASQARDGAGVVAGAACWALTVIYFLVQHAVAAAWPTPYDPASNSISDLGVTGCGDLRQFGDRVVYVCSPRHARHLADDARSCRSGRSAVRAQETRFPASALTEALQ